MISDSLYYLGGHSSSSIYSDLIYEQERSDSVIETPADGIERKVTWTGKIGVPYPSDLGYAADLESCTVKLGSYSNKNCSSTSWTKPIFNSSFNWLMTPDSSGVVMLWVVSSSGFIDVGYDPAYLGYGVVPTLYLDSSVVIDANVGTGDINNPYRIIVS